MNWFKKNIEDDKDIYIEDDKDIYIEEYPNISPEQYNQWENGVIEFPTKTKYIIDIFHHIDSIECIREVYYIKQEILKLKNQLNDQDIWLKQQNFVVEFESCITYCDRMINMKKVYKLEDRLEEKLKDLGI